MKYSSYKNSLDEIVLHENIATDAYHQSFQSQD
jgi:hypothetical protein